MLTSRILTKRDDFGTSHHITNESVSGAEADDDFGDFDDFEQGYSGQPVEDFDDFDDFGDGFQTAEPATTQEPTRVEEPPDFPFVCLLQFDSLGLCSFYLTNYCSLLSTSMISTPSLSFWIRPKTILIPFSPSQKTSHHFHLLHQFPTLARYS